MKNNPNDFSIPAWRKVRIVAAKIEINVLHAKYYVVYVTFLIKEKDSRYLIYYNTGGEGVGTPMTKILISVLKNIRAAQ